jgi:hypothetical protein
MLGKSERRQLFEWIDPVNFSLLQKRGPGSDFADGVSLMEVLHYYLPRTFLSSKFTRTNAPSKRLENWKKIIKELGRYEVFFEHEMIENLSKERLSNEEVEELLFGVMQAISGMEDRPTLVSRPTTSTKRTKTPASKKISKKIVNSYLDYLDDDSTHRLPPIYKKNSVKGNISRFIDRLDGEEDGKIMGHSLGNKHQRHKKHMSSNVSIFLGGQSVDSEKEERTREKVTNRFSNFVDKLDGKEDGSFMGVQVGSDGESSEDPNESLEEKVARLQTIIHKQEKELKELRSLSGHSVKTSTGHSVKTSISRTPSKQAAKSHQRSPSSDSADFNGKIESVTFNQDQSKELTDKVWMNVRNEHGKAKNIYFNNKTRDLTIRDGAHVFTDPTETLQFDLKAHQTLEWKTLRKYIESDEFGFKDGHADESHTNFTFIPILEHFITKRTKRTEQIESKAKSIPLKVRNATKQDIEICNDFIDEVEDKIERERREDAIHDTELTRGIPYNNSYKALESDRLENFQVIQAANHLVIHGTILFFKVDIGSGKYIHLRFKLNIF